MKVAVRYLAQLRQAAGCTEEEINLDGPCLLQDLLRQLADRHGEHFRRLLLASADALQPSILLFVGEDQVRWDTPVKLRDGDVITVLSPMAGG
ncbi:MAG TPA: MoaD/ThiS family protein [Gemmataceae bacterium]|jgi:MoaD family protein|nr:MoaD/ThiS family protein [Gemmataceae bacterium]